MSQLLNQHGRSWPRPVDPRFNHVTNGPTIGAAINAAYTHPAVCGGRSLGERAVVRDDFRAAARRLLRAVQEALLGGGDN